MIAKLVRRGQHTVDACCACGKKVLSFMDHYILTIGGMIMFPSATLKCGYCHKFMFDQKLVKAFLVIGDTVRVLDALDHLTIEPESTDDRTVQEGKGSGQTWN